MMPSQDPLEKAQQKIRVWKREAERVAAPVNLQDGIDLTTHPSEPQATFPGLTPFRILTARDVLVGDGKLVSFPSVNGTASVSACVGAAAVVVLFLKPLLTGLRYRFPEALKKSVGNSSQVTHLRAVLRFIIALLRLTVTLVAVLWFARFLKSRRPIVRSLSRYTDISTTPNAGPCVVADSVLMITSSQAGTHADMPTHFVRCSPLSSPAAFPLSASSEVPSLRNRHGFDEAHYTGDVVLVDIAQELRELSFDTNAISVEVVDRAIEKLPPDYQNGSKQLWRLVFVTRRLSPQVGTPARHELDPRMAYLVPEAVEFLCRKFPLLLLVGTDAASVDALSASPLCDGSHGTLLRHGVAILENLRCDDLYTLLAGRQSDAVLEGSLLTVFNPVLCFEDARGCSVVFFPRRAPPGV